MSLLLGFLRRLVVARKPIFSLTACNELNRKQLYLSHDLFECNKMD